jgi:hypothetical protein
MEVDILIGAKNIEPRDFLSVSDPEQRAYMSTSVSTLSKSLIKRQSYLFKDLVRVAKDWRDSFQWAPHCKPKSYLLEIIMLEAFKRMGFCSRHTLQTKNNWPPPYFAARILQMFFSLIGSVKSYYKDQKYDKDNLTHLFVCCTPYYQVDDLPMDSPEPLFESTRVVGKGKKAQEKTRKATAIVMDPVNPTNNLWLTLGNADSLVKRAKKAADQLQ